jgi:hypothetical protein
MAVCLLDYSLRAHRRMQPVHPPEGCEACNVFGQCSSCWPAGGRERRRAQRNGSIFLVDSVPLYSRPDHELTDPIRITASQVQKARKAQRDPQLQLLGAA